MKGLIGLLLLVASTQVLALATSVDEFQSGKILRVTREPAQSPEYQFGSGNPADAPLTSTYYRYEVAVRVDCALYVGRYDSQVKYLPAVLRAENLALIRVTRHHLFFDLPGHQRWEMNVVRKKAYKGDCAADRGIQ